MQKIGLILTLILMAFTQAYACGNKQLQANKRVVMNFYEALINQKDFNAAAKYLGPVYKQHNPDAEDGINGLKKFVNFLKTNYPNAHSEIKQVFADGDFVVLHVFSVREPGTHGRAIFDLFKLKNGKIIEHWDAVQDIPEKSANNNTMF